jgi:hypothetical protein
LALAADFHTFKQYKKCLLMQDRDLAVAQSSSIFGYSGSNVGSDLTVQFRNRVLIRLGNPSTGKLPFGTSYYNTTSLGHWHSPKPIKINIYDFRPPGRTRDVAIARERFVQIHPLFAPAHRCHVDHALGITVQAQQAVGLIIVQGANLATAEAEGADRRAYCSVWAVISWQAQSNCDSSCLVTGLPI